MKETKSLAILLGVLVAVAAVGMGAGIGMVGPGMMGPGMMWGYGGAGTAVPSGSWGLAMALGGIAMVAFWAAIVVGAVLLVRWLVGAPAPQSSAGEAGQPLAILRRRYAAGEIDEATYERMKGELAA